MIHINKSASVPEPNKIIFNFSNYYLELIRLLNEAAAIEHLLMLQYLYATFSIKEVYRDVRGSEVWQDYIKGSPQRKTSLLRVAIEEMQHLGMVNEFLAALGASPNLVAGRSDEVADIYPFTITLKPLSLQTTATYLYVEADSKALDPNSPHTAKELVYISQVREHFKKDPTTNHIGSLYGSIIECAEKVSSDPPDFLKNQFIDWNKFHNNMGFIKEEGELEHYKFFKEVFTSTHKGFNGKQVWDFPVTSPHYPSVQFECDQTTAYFGKENIIKDPVSRKIGWLGNLHYWIILALLDVNYRNTYMAEKYRAIGNMTGTLYQLGVTLAKRNIGMPFDQMNINPNFGKSTSCSLQIIKLLMEEAKNSAQQLRNELPDDFNFDIYADTLNGLTKSRSD